MNASSESTEDLLTYSTTALNSPTENHQLPVSQRSGGLPEFPRTNLRPSTTPEGPLIDDSPMTSDDLDSVGGLLIGFPLWLPYVVFTVVLLSLIVVSFARFHVLRGSQYRNRQLESERSQQNKNNGQLPVGGGGDQPNGMAPSAGGPPEYLTLFLEFSRDSRSSDATTTVGGRGSSTRPRPTRTRSDDIAMYSTKKTPTKRPSTGDRRGGGGGGGGGGASGGRASDTRRSLAYAFNDNGSMVDIRCNGDERTNTFRRNDDDRTHTFRLTAGGGAISKFVVGGGGTGIDAAVDEEDAVVIVLAGDDYDPTIAVTDVVVTTSTAAAAAAADGPSTLTDERRRRWRQTARSCRDSFDVASTVGLLGPTGPDDLRSASPSSIVLDWSVEEDVGGADDWSSVSGHVRRDF